MCSCQKPQKKEAEQAAEHLFAAVRKTCPSAGKKENIAPLHTFLPTSTCLTRKKS
jgi:hypothetical protein